MALQHLSLLDSSQPYAFSEPVKRIQDGKDVDFWLRSKAYSDIMGFLLQLNTAMFPTCSDPSAEPKHISEIEWPDPVRSLRQLLNSLLRSIDQVPPDPGPRRFGNVSFRKWVDLLQFRSTELLAEHVPLPVLRFGMSSTSKTAQEANIEAQVELKSYLLGSFGSSQRLDYGTGHELSFLAFIAGLWRLNFFGTYPAGIEKSIVLGIMDPYFRLVRKLIKTYNLEPAGSHGVWGLDDHSFLPYIFGSAQLSSPLSPYDSPPSEGSALDAPKTGDITNAKIVQEWRSKNLYFGAIGFINDVKKGPFWEHSPMLYDISGVPAGWAKINKVGISQSSI
jgi:serine/threonine-protein phosphatase 2A activator